MMKSLRQIIQSIKPIQIVGNADVAISDVVCDSRKAAKGSLFVAVNGVAVDAHQFIPNVVAAGASAVVCEHLPEQISDDVTFVVVKNSTEALPFIAGEWYDHPSEHLTLVGVTGTNGKTTITYKTVSCSLTLFHQFP